MLTIATTKHRLADVVRFANAAARGPPEALLQPLAKHLSAPGGSIPVGKPIAVEHHGAIEPLKRSVSENEAFAARSAAVVDGEKPEVRVRRRSQLQGRKLRCRGLTEVMPLGRSEVSSRLEDGPGSADHLLRKNHWWNGACGKVSLFECRTRETSQRGSPSSPLLRSSFRPFESSRPALLSRHRVATSRHSRSPVLPRDIRRSVTESATLTAGRPVFLDALNPGVCRSPRPWGWRSVQAARFWKLLLFRRPQMERLVSGRPAFCQMLHSKGWNFERDNKGLCLQPVWELRARKEL